MIYNPFRIDDPARGEPVNFGAVARDITVRKSLERELERERDRLRLLLDLNNRVVSNLDLRELLRAIAASIRRVMECDAVSVTLPASRTNQLRVFALDFPKSKGFSSGRMPGAGQSLGARQGFPDGQAVERQTR